MGSKKGLRVLALNRRARRDYEIFERVEAGISLLGTEVKSIRAGKIQLKDSFIEFRDNEAHLIGAHVSPYSHGNRENHDPERPRKLLLHRRELDRLEHKAIARGFTVIPLSVHLKGNRIKLELALARGKKLYDKRMTERQKELDREAAEVLNRRSW